MTIDQKNQVIYDNTVAREKRREQNSNTYLVIARFMLIVFVIIFLYSIFKILTGVH